jgi:hypothetical protein
MTDEEPGKKPKVDVVKLVAKMWKDGGPERTRLVVWVVLAGAGVYLIVTGIIGVMTKAR